MHSSPLLRTKSAGRAKALFAGIAVAALLLAATPMGGATGSTATTTNSTPAIGATYYYSSDPTSDSGATCKATGRLTSFAPTSGSTTTLHVCVEATDANGFEDVCDTAATSSSEVHRFSVTDSAGVSISDQDHVKTNVALACATGSGTAVALIGSFQMEYWRPAGLSGSSTAYIVVPEVTDVAGAAASSNPATFDYTSLTSLDSTTTGTIDLGGALAPGATGTEAAASIYNKGNAAFTIQISGSALSGGTRGQTLAVGNLKWAGGSGTTYGNKTALTGSAVSTAVSAPAETADVTTAYPVYVQLAAPAGSGQWVPADTYTGTVTFTAG